MIPSRQDGWTGLPEYVGYAAQEVSPRAVQSRKGSLSMSKITKYVGIDVHKDSNSIAVAEEGRSEPRFLERIPGCNTRLLRVLKTLGPLKRPGIARLALFGQRLG